MMPMPPICDFCGSAETAWVFPAESYVDQELGAHSIDSWMACAPCAALIRVGQYDALAMRAMANPAVTFACRMMGKTAALVQVRRLHQHFHEHRKGEPYRCES